MCFATPSGGRAIHGRRSAHQAPVVPQRHELPPRGYIEALRRDDELCHDESWSWMQPPRHALGAVLLEQGRLQEAEAAFAKAWAGADVKIPASCYCRPGS